MFEHRIRTEITDEFTRTAAKHIQQGDLKRYEVNGNFIFKYLTQEEYSKAIENNENEPFIMKEIGVEASYDFSYKL